MASGGAERNAIGGGVGVDMAESQE